MRQAFFLINLLVFSILIYGQDLTYTKSVIEKLASPEFMGRGYVGNGDKLAADFLSEEFGKIGLESFSENYFQEFEVDVNTFPDDLLLKINKEVLVPGKDYIVDPMSASRKGKYGVFVVKKHDLLSELMLKQIIQNASGKFLVIDERGYESDDAEDKKKLNELISFLKYSPQMKTAGTIMLTSEKLTWWASTIQLSKPIFIVNKGEKFQINKKVEVKVDAKFIEKYKTRNVIGYIKGKEVPDSFLVVTAHYDHLGKMGEDVYIPGANDNSSGIAMILNLARHFKKNPPKYSIVFMALGAEELGILGAKYYTENPLFDLKSIKFLVNFDLAGTGDEGITVVNATVHKDEFNRMLDINNTNKYLVAIKHRGPACNSDHCMFHQKEVPCFYIYTLGGIKAYHDIYDKYETLPLTDFVDYSKLMIEFFDGF